MMATSTDVCGTGELPSTAMTNETVPLGERHMTTLDPLR